MQLAYVAGAWLLLAGCGRFAFDTTSSSDATTSDTASVDARVLTCTGDNFDTGVPVARWMTYAVGPTLQAVGMEVRITLNANMNGYAGLDSKFAIDLTDGTAQIEVPMVVGTPNAENYFILNVDNMNYYGMHFDGGSMYYRRRTGGNDFVLNEAYDAVAHRYWRFGHDVTKNEIVYATSPNATDWTERFRAPVTVPITALQAEVAAGEYAGGSPTPGEARFDNFQLCLA